MYRTPQKTRTGHHKRHVPDTTEDMYRTPQKACTGHHRKRVPFSAEGMYRTPQSTCTGHHRKHVPDTTEDMYRAPQKAYMYRSPQKASNAADVPGSLLGYLLDFTVPSTAKCHVRTDRCTGHQRRHVPDPNEGMYRTLHRPAGSSRAIKFCENHSHFGLSLIHI